MCLLVLKNEVWLLSVNLNKGDIAYVSATVMEVWPLSVTVNKVWQDTKQLMPIISYVALIGHGREHRPPRAESTDYSDTHSRNIRLHSCGIPYVCLSLQQ